MVGVAEAERVASDELDHTVDTLALGVAVTGVDERFDLGPPAAGGGGELADFGDAGVRAAGEKPPASLTDLVTVGAGAGAREEVAEVPLGEPSRQQCLSDLSLV
ncbi:hypothetical protein OHA79_46260 (plasmid) [Streptomyces sp. NBC_00841]|nr:MULTISPECIES: hypothetical protein [unclassified Streptomyces]WSA05040.1 hypothetical protein OHA79_46260 [Streptomyces sp. NBC_00841]WSJ91957.1 hypothetical protein OG395_00495 [Streptomyces sp. NBC_01320]WSK01130.1 hypothetical protein OG395_54860 [Streptomyces sp. NBC_01320]